LVLARGCARRAQLHASAGRSIEHPGRHHDDDAGLKRYMDDLTARTLFAVLTHDATTVQRMPSVENLDLLPDMGRMTP